jgi:hypothetical protein
MKAIRVSQLLWAGLLFFLLMADALAVELVATETLLVLAIMYVVASIFALGSNRIVWLVTLLMPVILFVTAALHALAVSTDKSLYINSRAVLYIVVANTLLFLLPCLILLAQFWRHRTALRSLFGAPAASAA